MLRVIVHLPDGTNQTFKFTSWRTTIGRSRSCDLTLVSSQISKSHAAIEIVDGQISIRDLGSRNGISVNGTFIDRQLELQASDQIQLGNVKLTIDPHSQIFDDKPKRPVQDLIFEESYADDDADDSQKAVAETLIGQPHQDINGGTPILRVLRITEDYIPRTVFRIAPFTLKLAMQEYCWIRPRFGLAEVCVDDLIEVTNYTFDEPEDELSSARSAVLARNFYRLPKTVKIVNARQTGRSSDGFRVFSELSAFDLFEFLFG